jgi:hypothetical protein
MHTVTAVNGVWLDDCVVFRSWTPLDPASCPVTCRVRSCSSALPAHWRRTGLPDMHALYPSHTEQAGLQVILWTFVQWVHGSNLSPNTDCLDDALRWFPQSRQPYSGVEFRCVNGMFLPIPFSLIIHPIICRYILSLLQDYLNNPWSMDRRLREVIRCQGM